MRLKVMQKTAGSDLLNLEIQRKQGKKPTTQKLQLK